MQFEKKEIRTSVIEGYQVLLRAEASLCLPEGAAFIGEFYVALAEKCIAWITEVRGERLRQSFLATEDARERARMRMTRYRFWMSVPWMSDTHAAILCESELVPSEGEERYRRISHVWCLAEESMLPTDQILELFGMQRALREVPFRPDGVYPSGGEMFFFKNAKDGLAFSELKKTIDKNGKNS